MKIGVNLINFGPGASPQSMQRWAQLAQALGYHLIMTSDHISITPDVQSRYPAPFYEPISTLGWLSGITTDIEIGTTVIIMPYRNVLEIAKATANIDQFSGGRLILGVGIGWAQQEFDALRVPFNQRGAITNEYLEALKILWTQDVASYQGKFVSFTDVHTAPRPLQTPHPPIWVGGPSDAALRRAVRYADAWHPIRISMDWFKNKGIPRLTAIAQEEGRPVPALCPRIKLRISDSPAGDDGRLLGEGNLEQVRRDLAGLEELGCDYVLLDTFYDDLEAVKNNEAAWRLLAVMAEQVLDLKNQTVR
ncbi:MAG: TIGR03619 family F420-dependent LLM class oxidoreductase [Chloroflexi bacterium]|nr:TIGR03619 family F420-dependent LLM class oxidoreductase [Chloroflexota bacterium]